MPLLNINRELLPMKLHYFAVIASTAALHPFLSTMAKQRGYSPVIIGFMFTTFPIPGLLLKSIVGVIIDKYKCHKLIIILGGIINCIVVCVLEFIPGQTEEKELEDTVVIKSPLFWLFSCCLISTKTVSFVRTVVDDTICIGLLGENKHSYGQQRLWGSVGWGTMSFISGLCVDWYSKGQIQKDYTLGYILSLTCTFLDMYVLSKIKRFSIGFDCFNISGFNGDCQILVFLKTHQELWVFIILVNINYLVVQNTDTKIEISGVKKLFTEAKVLIFLIWVIAFGIFTAFIMYFLFLHMEYLSDIYHPETKSWMKTIQGFSIAIQSVGGEIPLFIMSSFILKHVNHMNVFSLMFFTFSVRFFMYSVIRNPIWILPVELLHGVTFALAYSTIVSYAAVLAPVGVEGTLQGITGTAFEGIGLSIGCSIGGYFFNRYGSITTFKIISGVAFVICIIQIIVNLLINRWTKIGEIENRMYNKVNIKDDAKEDTTTM